ncbi:fasciclin domain-containing protein [Owenweeksia hongkongensis]|uniref:fasciclin domain-containing protein n=1 Tax=Owenweeksia hongkongensis TaxID=253245 RepID=UPI003A932775
MKMLTQNFGKLLLAGGVIFMASCSKDDDNDTTTKPTQKDATVKEVMEEEEQYSMMNEAIEESDQSSFFSNTSANITVFAANNDAFNSLFAEMNVSSMTELKGKLGDEAFADLIMYHAINGKFDINAIEDGYMETYADNDNNGKLSVFIENDNNTRLIFNGGDDHGASTASSTTISASNGSVIEINAVLSAQTNYENLEDAEEAEDNGETSLFLTLIADADVDIKNRLESETSMSTVIVADENELQSMLSINLAAILDVDDLNNLLDASAQTSLFTQFGVSTVAELLLELNISDLLSISGMTMANIYAEMEADDKAELMSTFIFNGYLNLKDEATNNGTVSSDAGADFDVSTSTSGQIVLTDDDGNIIFLEENSAHSVNGSIYTIAKVEEM